LQDPAPSVFLKQFGDNSIDFELVVWCSEMSHRPARFKSDLNFLVERHLRQAGIEIPFPQRDVYIRSGSIDVTTHAAERNAVESDGARA
ncbi:MAG: mechanosensitive ion channel, partial [Verrucomicrobiota bacterium]|nr:mechanosensitive ion channel [Verrucomicrobiota bacterium]